MDSFSWNALCKNVKKIRVKKYQSFSILFINRVTWIYGSNSFGQCPFCHTDAKVCFIHVFYTCPKVQDVWTFVLMKLGKDDLSMVQAIMGHRVSKTLFNCSVIIRYLIYVATYDNSKLSPYKIWDIYSRIKGYF